jgi:GT2 family glycosyltransferase
MGGWLMDVSVIIVNWNTREMLRGCIDSVRRLCGEIECEIRVVDNASSDGSAEMVKSEFPDVHLIENSRNLGFAAANNQALPHCRGRYILLLNSDTLLCENALEKTVAYADSHQRVGIVGCQVLNDSEDVQMTCFCFPTMVSILFRALGLSAVFKYNKFFGQEWMLWWRRDSERHVDVVSGMFMLTRKKAVDEVGLMDDSFFMYYEETDWCLRFAKAGWERVFYPEANVVHVHGGGQSSRKQMVRMFVQQQKSLLIFLRKHHGGFWCGIGRLLLVCAFAIRSSICGAARVVPYVSRKIGVKNADMTSKMWAAFKYSAFGVEPTRG